MMFVAWRRSAYTFYFLVIGFGLVLEACWWAVFGYPGGSEGVMFECVWMCLRGHVGGQLRCFLHKFFLLKTYIYIYIYIHIIGLVNTSPWHLYKTGMHCHHVTFNWRETFPSWRGTFIYWQIVSRRETSYIIYRISRAARYRDAKASRYRAK